MSFKKIIRKFFGNTLYYPGCLTKYVLKDIQQNYERILKNINVSYITIDKEFCCGSPVINAGYYQDFDNVTKKNKEVFDKYGVSKVLFNCPSCYHVFSDLYKDKLDTIEFEHFSTFLLDAVKKGKIRFKKSNADINAAYHDPCHLGRACNIYEQPRELLKLLGVDLKEMIRTKSDSRCCGAGAGLRNYDTKFTNSITLKTLKGLERKNIPFLISTCPMCYLQFKTVAERKNMNIKVLELSQLILTMIEGEDFYEKYHHLKTEDINKLDEQGVHDC